MKVLRVTSVTPFGDATIDHPIYSGAPEADMVVATLKGVINAGSAIKSFELVEANNG